MVVSQTSLYGDIRKLELLKLECIYAKVIIKF